LSGVAKIERANDSDLLKVSENRKRRWPTEAMIYALWHPPRKRDRTIRFGRPAISFWNILFLGTLVGGGGWQQWTTGFAFARGERLFSFSQRHPLWQKRHAETGLQTALKRRTPWTNIE